MFDGKVALVTGAARGIGLSIAKELLRNNLKGVALLDINSEAGQKAADGLAEEFGIERAIFVEADVSQRSQFEDAFEKTMDTFGQLDIVVNNAGILQEIEWEKCIAVNWQGCITGSLLALDTYFPKTLGVSERIILNVSSVFGLAPAEFEPVYSATKYGVIGFSKSLSGSNRCRYLNVKVLTICPGGTITSLSGSTTKPLPDDMWELRRKLIQKASFQSSEQLAQHTLSIMKEGISGSVWVIDNNTRYEVNVPDLFDF